MSNLRTKTFFSLLVLSLLCSPILKFVSADTSAEQGGDKIISLENETDYSTSQSDFTSVTIRTPDNTVIDALKYVGSDTPASSHPNESHFSGITKVKASSYYYNCHGFAWYFCGKTNGITNAKAFIVYSGGVDEYISLDCYTIETHCNNVPCDELTDSQYRSYISPGDVIVYVNDDPGHNPKYTHSAVVLSVSSSEIRVISKWGEYCVYSHSVVNCPYSASRDPSNLNGKCNVKVYHPSHFSSGTVYINNTVIPNAASSSTYEFDRYVGYNMEKHKMLCDCGRAYKLQSHSFVHLAGPRYKCSKCGCIYDSGISPDSLDPTE